MGGGRRTNSAKQPLLFLMHLDIYTSIQGRGRKKRKIYGGGRVGVLQRWCGGGHGHGRLKVDAGLVCVVPSPDVLLHWTWPDQAMLGSGAASEAALLLLLL